VAASGEARSITAPHMRSRSTRRRPEPLLGDLTFPEGPRWHDGRLYVSDFYDHRVLALAPDAAAEVVCEVPGQPSGLGFAPDGALLVVSMTDRRLLRREPDGTLREVADLSAHAPFHCNDMCVDAAGRAYVGNFGSDPAREPFAPTALLRVDPDGAVAVAAPDLLFPNGAVIAPGGTLLVAETFAFRISAFDVDAEGDLSGRRIWAAFGAEPAHDLDAALATRAIAPDGICLDAEGALWVADALGAGAHRVREGGEVLETVDAGAATVYAVALGGADGRTLHLCCGPRLDGPDPATVRHGAIATVRVEVPGIAWA